VLQPGDRVCERFVIEKLVGAGARGEVYRCRDSKLNNRLVAVKVLRSPFLHDARLRDRIASEVRALSELNHPHICTTHELCSHDHRPAIVLEFLYGISLAKRLTTALNDGDAHRFGAQIADALTYAHGHGVVHGAIRPANIILTPQGVKLIDFALTSLVSRDSRRDASVGGSFYVSPEQLAGEELDHQTDIYSLGLVLCQMYTRFAPHPDSGIARRTLIAGAIQQVSSQPVRQIIEKCVREDRDERWATARDLLGALRMISESAIADSRDPAEDKRSPKP